MKLTIEQKQAIYEHLLTLDCPDLLAALLASRAKQGDLLTIRGDSLSQYISRFGFWSLTPEGSNFWSEMYKEVLEAEVLAEREGKPCNDYEVEVQWDKAGVAMPSEFESPSELDFAPTGGETTKIEILVNAPLDTSTCTWTQDVKALSFWTKVKLFFGKWNYKV